MGDGRGHLAEESGAGGGAALLAATRTAHLAALDHLRRASAGLEPELASIAADHLRITQRFLDAQRALLARRLELAAQARARGVAAPPSHTATASAELASLLDRWWAEENRVALAAVAQAPSSGRDTADRAPADHMAGEALVETIVARLDAAEVDELTSVLVELERSLEPRREIVHRAGDLAIRGEPMEVAPARSDEPFWPVPRRRRWAGLRRSPAPAARAGGAREAVTTWVL